MILIDTIYQQVLAIANKEQRGYITPQEFNLFANLVQMEIFEQYFYDIHQFNALKGNSTEYADMVTNLNEKILPFEEIHGPETPVSNIIELPDIYRLGTVILQDPVNGNTEIQEIQDDEILYINKSKLTRPTITNPMYIRRGSTANANESLQILPLEAGSMGIICNYVRRPHKVQWGYVVINNKAMYDPTPTKTFNFELHPSEGVELVYRILKLSGITLNKAEIVQSAQALEQTQIQQEKQ